MSVKIIAAVSRNNVIGNKLTNDLPWAKDKYPEDMKWFRKMTAGATIICGRFTYESFGSHPLPNRRNIVITRQKLDGVECYDNLENAITAANITELGEESQPPPEDQWLIGGRCIYEEGLKYTSEIFLTLIPEIIEGDKEDLVFFPTINASQFQVVEYIPLEDSNLQVARYVRV